LKKIKDKKSKNTKNQQNKRKKEVRRCKTAEGTELLIYFLTLLFQTNNFSFLRVSLEVGTNNL